MRVNFRVLVLLAGLSLLQNMTTAQPHEHLSFSTEADIHVDQSGIPSEVLYHASSPFLKRSDDPSGRYCRIVIPGHHFTSETGTPELPVFSRIIEVPEGMSVKATLTEVISSRIRFSDQQMKGLLIYPSQRARTKNELPDEKVVIIDKKVYQTRGIIKHDTVMITRVGKFRGRDLMNIAIYPAFYDPSSESVDLITSMKVDIGFEPCITKGTITEPFPDSKGGDDSKLFIPGYSNKPVTMVIITDSIFSKALKPLVQWKTRKGIKVKMVYRESGPMDTVYKELKNKLTSIYETGLASGNAPQYLMIVGDPSIIPTSRGTTNISDLYYGEFDGSGDYIPELYIGRLPVKDTIQLKAVVKKIVDYESYSYLSSNTFWAGALTTAGNDSGKDKYMNGQVNYIYENYLKPDPTINGHKWLYPDAQLKDDSIKILVNNGLSILNYTGHGESGGFSDPTFKVPSVINLTNTNKYPLVIANACRTAQINVTPCFGTEMVNAIGKGAMGYIGCTNDSYWDEDFFWAVGPGTPGTDVTYENTGLGAFDRLFHSHAEEPGDWLCTLGQINFAGNLAVSASTSPRKKYYWETYILLGDPSMTPLIGKPDTFDIEVPDTIPPLLKTLSFFTRPFAYAALSDFDTLWDANFASPSGNVSLNIPEGVKDSCMLVVTGQNMIPLKKTIYIGTVRGEFITAENVVYDDSQGNGNNMADYGEKINLKVTLKNLGEGSASNLNAILSVKSGMITVEQGTVTISSLPGGTTYTIDDKFLVNVSDEAEDGKLASLLLKVTDDFGEYNFGIDLTLHAPDIRIISSIPDDIPKGNGNYLPDPGETIMLNVKIINEGSSATEGVISIDESNPYLSLSSIDIPTGLLEPGVMKVISFECVISPAAPSGATGKYKVNMVCGKYSTTGEYSLRIGKTRETWEYNRFDVFPWIQQPGYSWTITSATASENLLSARSASIPDKSESILAISLNNPVRDTISFFIKVSSEAIYDELIFRIDSTDNFKISGETTWEQKSAIIKPGIHYLEWVYKKDISLTGGLDAAWVDMINFPDISFLEADLRIDTVFAPSEPVQLNQVVIRGRVVNLGRYTLTSFPLAYRINDEEMVNETFYLKIEPGDSLEVSFTQTCSLNSDINYRISVINRLPEDGYHLNDTAYTYFIKTGINDPDSSEDALTVSPNPFTNALNLDYESYLPGEITIELIDIQGRTVIRRSEGIVPGRNRLPIDCSWLARGVYTIRVTDRGKIITRRVIKG